MKYTEGSTVVDAIQWQPGMEIEGVSSNERGTFLVKDRGRFITAAKLTPGAWIVTYPDGEKFVRYNDLFEQTYKKL